MEKSYIFAVYVLLIVCFKTSFLWLNSSYSWEGASVTGTLINYFLKIEFFGIFFYWVSFFSSNIFYTDITFFFLTIDLEIIIFWRIFWLQIFYLGVLGFVYTSLKIRGRFLTNWTSCFNLFVSVFFMVYCLKLTLFYFPLAVKLFHPKTISCAFEEGLITSSSPINNITLTLLL